MGVAQNALRQVMLLYKPRTREKHEVYLASVKLLFHQDGKGWTLRQTSSSPPAMVVASSEVVEPGVEPTPVLVCEAQHEEFSDIDYGGDDDADVDPRVPVAVPRPEPKWTPVKVGDVECARNQMDPPFRFRTRGPVRHPQEDVHMEGVERPAREASR